jgi:acetyl esterase/lipase
MVDVVSNATSDSSDSSDSCDSPGSSQIFRTIARTDRSLILRLIQACMNPFDGRLARPPKRPYDAFSTELKIPDKAKVGLVVRRRMVCDMNIYDFSRRSLRTGKEALQVKRRIYYFNGGGFQSPATSHHIKLLGRMARALPHGTVVSLVSYPLAPVYPAPKAFPALLQLYHEILTPDSSEESIILAGDSAGANIVLALTMEALRQDPRGPAPNALVLISPAVELSHTNPALPESERADPLLRLALINKFAAEWAGGWDTEKDPRVSPLQAQNLGSLRERGVKVHMVLGTSDILTPDALLLRDRLIEEGVGGSCLEWEGLSHCWLIMAGVGRFTRELRVGWKFLIDVLVDSGTGKGTVA